MRSCTEDVQFLKLCQVSYILDSRPKANAVGNQALGGGYEDTSQYENCQLMFLNIPNIHYIRDSLQKVLSLCAESALIPLAGKEDWWASLSSTNWFNYIRTILIASVTAARLVHQDGRSILIHCSDGWDRTTQMCALSELMIDPFYRTVRGFEILIEKDWVSFGHKFSQRLGHGEKHISDERSPIFIQFLDCVYQIMLQFPAAFEFKPTFLDFIADNVFSCKFGTFIGDCEAERTARKVKNRTVSIWSVANSAEMLPSFINSFYMIHEDALAVNCDQRIFSLWPYYYRWDGSFCRRPNFLETAFKRFELEQCMNSCKEQWRSKLKSVAQRHDSHMGRMRVLSKCAMKKTRGKIVGVSKHDAELKSIRTVSTLNNETFNHSSSRTIEKVTARKQAADLENDELRSRASRIVVREAHFPFVACISETKKNDTGYVSVRVEEVHGDSMVSLSVMEKRDAEWQAAWSALEADRRKAYGTIAKLNEKLAALTPNSPKTNIF